MSQTGKAKQKPNDIEGYLRRAGKGGRSIGLRRKRFYKLHGAILSKHVAQDCDASWDVNVQGSEAMQLGKTHFALALSQPAGKSASNDFEQNTLMLYAKTEEECKSWVTSLKYAANRKLEYHYEIGKQIGAGGFAKVRLGRCVITGELRAIKTMEKTDATANIFGTEIAIIKRVSHPNIVKTYDIYETASKIHIVMEYMQGGMLYEAIEDGIRFKEGDVVQFMKELLDGIHYLHSRGIVHRDLKPENVLCTSKQTPLHVKIADFGLSSIADVAQIRANQILMSTMTGTPEFIAPEIANRQEYSEKVDIWALGMLCYNVICGKLPLDEESEMIPQLQKGISVTFPEPEWQEYSEESKSFIKALLCNRPEKRLTSLACLVHPWLYEQGLKTSSTIAEHGRISKYLSEKMSPITSSSECLFSRSSSVNEGLSGNHRAQGRRLWIISIIAVLATNRLYHLIHPDRYNHHASANSTSKYPAESYFSHTESAACDSVIDEDIMGFIGDGHDTEEECHSFTFPSQNDLAADRLERAPKTVTGAWLGRSTLISKQSLRKTFSGSNIQLSRAKSMDAGKANMDRVESAVPTRKPSLRKKLLAAFSGESSGKVPPVRKLSKKLTRKGNDKCSNVPSSRAENSVDLDLDLDGINVTNVDESEVLLLESIEARIPGPYDGKRDEEAATAKSNQSMSDLSPVTPQKRGV